MSEMTSVHNNIVLVGFQGLGNLGLGYLAAVLRENSYTVIIIDIETANESILHEIKKYNPILIGFSLIFQYYLPEIKQLVTFLRANGINCHMTVGGHFPSLRFEKTLDELTNLDSVIRFEGEFTLLELADCISAGKDWRHIENIAYKNSNNQTVSNNLRGLIKNLDLLPRPYRTSFNKEILGLRVQPVLATRGCPQNCSFCSIRAFYSQAKGKVVRRRDPGQVVLEMRDLYENHNVRIFLFQDDDFPLVGKAGKKWVYQYIDELDKNGLLGNVLWKISCRVDDLDRQLFLDMKQAGLYLVYLGIESGSPASLITLNKNVKLEDNYRAITLLKELDIMFGYGFMLVDPSSTFNSILENVRFLRDIVGDGSAAVVFCKMLPYAGTPIEQELITTNRLTGNIEQPDYSFLDHHLDDYYQSLNESMLPWICGKDALSNYITLMWHEISIIQRMFYGLKGMNRYINNLKSITKQINNFVLNLIENSVKEYQMNRIFPFSPHSSQLEASKNVDLLLGLRDSFIYKNQEVILTQLDRLAKLPGAK